MIYKKLGQKLFCNASVLSKIEAIGYSKKMRLYIKGEDANISDLNDFINEFELVRSE